MLSVLILFPFSSGAAENGRNSDFKNEVLQIQNVIDEPVTDTLSQYMFGINTRFYSGGGTRLDLSFGVWDSLNLGISMTVDELVGSGTSVRMRTPEVNLKWRFYDGNMNIPSFAIGYDGQGYYYDSDEKEYAEEKRGLYLVSNYTFFSSLLTSCGFNMSDFDNNHIFAFIGLNYTIQNRVALMAEYDNLFESHETNRFNAGIRFFVTPNVNIDFAAREIGTTKDFPNGERAHSERIVQARYITRF